MKIRYYIFIHIKDLYSVVECLKRGFDPETKNLVVAKFERTNKTRCLDVSPAMKRLGVKANPRLFDIPKEIKYVIAEPSMTLYYKYSAAVYEILVRFISKDDICVNSTTEMFADITDYITKYGETAREISEKLQSVIYNELKLKPDIGIGTNIYLAKAAAMLLPDKIAFLDDTLYFEKIIKDLPLNDFWFITREEAEALAGAGILTMYDVLQKCPENCVIFKKRFNMICECAKADLPVNIEKIKTGNIRHSDKSIFPVTRTNAFKNALTYAGRQVVPKIEFSISAFETVKEKLKNLKKDELVRLVYYSNGEYIKLCGVISKIDTKNQSITIVDKTLNFSDIMKIY